MINEDVIKRIERCINDMFAFSSSANMDKWCDLFNYIKEAGEMVYDIELLKFYKALADLVFC